MKLSDMFLHLHQRDGGGKVRVNVGQLGAYKLAPAGSNGTTIWCLGRQEPWYVKESVEEIDKLLDVEFHTSVTNITNLSDLP